jgi:CheY-like chemotaxis protein
LFFQAARILIADDEPDNRTLLETWLAEVGFDCVAVADGMAALRELEAFQFDAVLLDITMPLLDGEQLAALLKSDPATAALPLIAVTASAMAEDRLRYARLFDACLIKPLNRAELTACLASFFGLPLAEDPPPATAPAEVEEPLCCPPAEALEELRRLARLGMTTRLEQQAAHWEAQGPRYLGFAKKLRELTHTFDHRRLLDFLEKSD